MGEKRLVPELRFPEFKRDWSIMSLSNFITSLDSGVSVNSENKPATEDQVGILKTSCISRGVFKPEENKSILENEISRARLNPKKDSILISRMNTPDLVGEIGYVPFDYPNLFLPDRLWMTKTNTRIIVKWLAYLLITPKNRSVISSIGTGTSGSMKNISKPNFLGLKFYCPELKEQQKIATFLTSVDQRIQLLEKKKAKLEAYKKGVMQQIFSQEVRFKDENGKDFPNWEEKKLGEIAKITTGKLDANAMVEKGKYRFYTCAKDFYFIDEFAFDFEALLISGNGANVGYVHYYKGKFNAYQRTYILYNIEESYLFIKFFLDINLQRRIHKEKKDGNTPYIVMNTLADMLIKIPCIKEQQKIAAFLSGIDKNIEQITQQIEKSKSFKKGLLQQLFV